MGLLNFFRRINRGIVLGIILVIGLSCYLAIDSIAFEDERETIKQVLEDYARDMEAFLLLPEKYREIGVNVPDPVIENKIKENNELVNKYFTSTTKSYRRNMKESIAGELERMLKSNQESGNKIKSCEARLTKVKNITKHGSNLVTVEAVMDITTISTLEAETFHLFHGGGTYYDNNLEIPADMSFLTRSYEITFTCEMVKRDGAWMFSNSEGMSTMHR